MEPCIVGRRSLLKNCLPSSDSHPPQPEAVTQQHGQSPSETNGKEWHFALPDPHAFSRKAHRIIMRFILEAASPEDRIDIAKVNEEFHSRQFRSYPCLDVKWRTDDGTARLCIIDRAFGPGWHGNSLAVCVGGDKYRISVSWDGPFAIAKYDARAYIYYGEMLLESLSADIRELAEAAIFAGCEYEHRRWDTDTPFPGVEIEYLPAKKVK